MTTTTKKKAQSNAHKAFNHYVATRKAYCKGQATIQQVAHSLAVLDLTLAIANINEKTNQANGGTGTVL